MPDAAFSRRSATTGEVQPRRDLYPSRQGPVAVQRPRLDPVLHGARRKDRPIGEMQVAQYEENGFLTIPACFAADEVDLLRRELDRLRGDASRLPQDCVVYEPDRGELRSIFQIHACSPVFARLAADSRLVDVARWLLDDEVYVHQSRLNYKPGFRGKEFYWHSDFETWHVEDGMPRMRAVSFSISLTENSEYNGPLLLLPGSHRTFVSCVGETPAEHFRSSLRRQEYGVPDDESLARLVAAGGIVSAKGPPGSVTMFDCNTMHGSNSNISPFPRSNAFIVYNAVGNALETPFCRQPPRPEFIAARADRTPMAAMRGSLCG